MKFDDIAIDPNCIDDYMSAPLEVRRSVDRRLKDWIVVGCLPPSAQAHRAYWYEDIWIVYITQGPAAWRLLVRCVDRVLIFLRLLNHDAMMDELR